MRHSLVTMEMVTEDVKTILLLEIIASTGINRLHILIAGVELKLRELMVNTTTVEIQTAQKQYGASQRMKRSGGTIVTNWITMEKVLKL